MDLQLSCCTSVAFTIQPPFNAIFPGRPPSFRRRRRPLWAIATTATRQAPSFSPPSAAAAVAAVGWQSNQPHRRAAPVSSLALLASKYRDPEREGEGDGELGPGEEDDSSRVSRSRRSSAAGGEESRQDSGYGYVTGLDEESLGLSKPPPNPSPRTRTRTRTRARARARTRSPAPPRRPLLSPTTPPPLDRKEPTRRARIPVPPLQRSLGVGRAAATTASPGRGEEVVPVEQIQASIEELLGMQGLGSGSWNKSGSVPAAVEREQRTLTREIKALGRRGRWGDVLEVIARARYQGTELNAIIYGCAINAVGRCGRYREAVMLLEQMPEEDIEPDEYSYRAAIVACSGSNQWERALGLFRRFQRAAATAEVSRDGNGGGGGGGDGGGEMLSRAASAAYTKVTVPGTATYNAVITACGRGLFTEEALGFFQEMADRGVPRDEVSYNAAIDACARGGLWRRALDLLSEMPSAGLLPSLASYNAALDACGRESRWEEASDLISIMRGDTYQDEDACEGDAELLRLVDLLEEEQKKTTLKSPSAVPPAPAPAPPAATTTAIGEGEGAQPRPPISADAGDDAPGASLESPPFDDETSFRTTMASLSTPSSPRPPRPDVRSYNSCIAACRRGGNSGLAKLFFYEMLSRGLRPDIWTFKSAMLNRVGLRPKAAASIASDADPAPTAMPSSVTKPRTRGGGRDSPIPAEELSSPPARPTENRTAGAFWREGLSMLEDVDAEGLGPDPPCVNLVLSECAKAGRWVESRSLLRDLRDLCPPRSSYHPGISKYNSVLKQLRNGSGRGALGTTPAAAGGAFSTPDEPRKIRGPGGGGSSASARGTGEDPVDLDGGGKRSGAEGWNKGHVARFLADMRAAGVSPDIETYQCAIRCATDAAVLDIIVADAAEDGAEPTAEISSVMVTVLDDENRAAQGRAGGGSTGSGGVTPVAVSGWQVDSED